MSEYEIWVCGHCDATYVFKRELYWALGDYLGVMTGGMPAINSILVCCESPIIMRFSSTTCLLLSDEWITVDEKKDRMEFLGGWNIE